MKKLTPVLVVDDIEPCVDFWVGRLGFTKMVEVPDGEKLGFIILEKDGVELMYQSRASVYKDLKNLAGTDLGSAVLYIEVDDLESVIEALTGVEVVEPKRKTFYGATEIFVREPGGNIIGFSQHG